MKEIKQEWFNRPQTVYETPDEIFEPLRDEFGFTLDVCALDHNKKCDNFFSPDDDGLSKDWSGVCWMNPPFGREMKKWVKKAYTEWKKGCTVVCLLPARTNTAWWHDWVMKGEVRFIRGEVTFKGQKNGLWMPMAIVVFKGHNRLNSAAHGGMKANVSLEGPEASAACRSSLSMRQLGAED